MDLTPLTADACLSIRDLRISLIPLGKNMGRTEGNADPAGFAPGLIDIDLKFPIFSLWSLRVADKPRPLRMVLLDREVLPFFR